MVLHGYPRDKAAQLACLRRIEAQVRGLHRMIEVDAYCIDILDQVSGVESALQSVTLSLVDDRVRHCVEASADRKMAGATRAMERLVRL